MDISQMLRQGRAMEMSQEADGRLGDDKTRFGIPRHRVLAGLDQQQDGLPMRTPPQRGPLGAPIGGTFLPKKERGSKIMTNGEGRENLVPRRAPRSFIAACLLACGCSVLIACGSDPQAAIKGMVSTQGGNSVAGLKIVAETRTDIQEEQAHASIKTATDAKGAFTLKTKLPKREYQITISHPQYFTERTSVEFPELGKTKMLPSIEMVAVPDLSGRVLACVSEAPVPAVTITLGVQRPTSEAAGAVVAKTDTDGKFSLSSIPETVSGIGLALDGYSKIVPVTMPRTSAPVHDLGNIYLCRQADAADISVFEKPFDIRPLFPPVEGCSGRCSYQKISWRSEILLTRDLRLGLYGERDESHRR